MKPQLVIVRGIPGSGKSTFAAEISSETGLPVFESDNGVRKITHPELDYNVAPAKKTWPKNNTAS